MKLKNLRNLKRKNNNKIKIRKISKCRMNPSLKEKELLYNRQMMFKNKWGEASKKRANKLIIISNNSNNSNTAIMSSNI